MFGLLTSQGSGNGEVGVEENHNGLCRELWVGKFLTLKEARVFFLKSTSLNMWVMWVYIVWVETWCIRYDKLAKQNVLQVSREKTLPARHSQKLAVTIYYDSSHSSHVLSTCFTSREGFSRATHENFFNLQFAFNLESSHFLSYITLTMKSHIKYRVQKIE